MIKKKNENYSYFCLFVLFCFCFVLFFFGVFFFNYCFFFLTKINIQLNSIIPRNKFLLPERNHSYKTRSLPA